jgi:hypothetical protein
LAPTTSNPRKNSIRPAAARLLCPTRSRDGPGIDRTQVNT